MPESHSNCPNGSKYVIFSPCPKFHDFLAIITQKKKRKEKKKERKENNNNNNNKKKGGGVKRV